MQIYIHQTDQTIADFSAIQNYIEEHLSTTSEGLHIFPELFLCGYPLQDLCLQKSFINKYQAFLNDLRLWLTKNINSETTCLLMGGLEYELTSNGLPKKIKNVIYQYGHGEELSAIYTKRLLPNYDIFDEKKYFAAGNAPKILNLFGKNLGLLICEDMWVSNIHKIDPVQELFDLGEREKIALDAIINLSASPFYIHKHQKRILRSQEISHQFQCPFYYVNKVGAEDEIIFDGRSFVLNGDELVLEAKRFGPQILEVKLLEKTHYQHDAKENENLTWEELFSADIEQTDVGYRLIPLSKEDCQLLLESLAFGVQEYAKKTGFSKFTIALSGGMDSALVLTILKLSLKPGQTLEAIYMPSVHSSPLSYELSLQLCQNLAVPLKSLPIKFLHSASKNLFSQTFPEKFEGLTDENIQARLRGLLLYTRSNQIGSMAINTSNKSELAVGYSTQYGDSVGAISMLGDLFKTEVFSLANYINEAFNNIIPQEIITRPPSAELREGQTDEESLPPYEILDAILEGILSYRYSKRDLLDLGFLEDHIDHTFNLYRRNEYKRYQFCPILKINSKSFGFGYRIPLSKNTDFYMDS